MSVHPNHAAFATRSAEKAHAEHEDHSLRLMAWFGALTVIGGLVFLAPYLAP